MNSKEQQTLRNTTIDILRGGSILIMIAMHIAPSFRQYPISDFIWSWGQWVVAVFLLCSFAVGKNEVKNLGEYIRYVFRRLKRLLIPYYIFLVAYLLVDVLLYKKSSTISTLLKNITLIGGVEFNWMILLFVIVTICVPICIVLVRRSQLMALLFFGVLCSFSWLYMSERDPFGFPYRLTMIPAWLGITGMLLLFLSWAEAKQWIRVGSLLVVSLLVWLVMYVWLTTIKQTSHLYFHKYPPDLYFTSFSMWSTITVYTLVRAFEDKTNGTHPLVRVLSYVSLHSYTIFFVHIIVLQIVKVLYPARQANYALFAALVYIATFLFVAAKIKIEAFFFKKT